jgi:pimeloyl-ACP methyl ester carboxylesterase
MLTEKSFDTGYATINYAEGSSGGEPLVMLHGGTAYWQQLSSLITELDQNWHIYACDKRGHGKSSHTKPYRVVDAIPDTVEFIKRNIGKSSVLLGHSGGAVISMGVAAQIPDMIQALILLDPPIFLREESIKTVSAYNYFHGVYAILTHQQTAKSVFSNLFQGIDEAGIQSLNDMVNQVDPEYVKTILDDRYFDGLDIQSILKNITCPTLLLYGEIERGAVVRDRDVEFFLNHIPYGTAIQITDAGHILQLDQPAQVLEKMEQWLQIHR